MADRLDVLLGILLDKAAQQDVERGLSEIEKGVTSLDKAASNAGDSMGSSWDQMGKDFEEFNTLFNERFKLINGKMVDLATGSKVSASSLREFTKINLNQPAKDLETIAAANAEAAKEAARAASEEEKLARQIRAVGQVGKLTEEQVRDLPEPLFQAGLQAAELQKKFEATRTEVERLNRSAAGIQRISTVLGAAGAAIVGGIALSANQYVSFVEKAGIQGDQTADRWVAASKRVQNAQLNLGQASAEVLLPVYEKAAELAEKAAEFVQENPDLVTAALNTGLVVATLGAVGVAVSKGIKLYADFKYLAATAEYSLATARFERSVQEFLTGSLLGGKTPGGAGAAAGGGGLAGAARTIGQVTLLASAVIIGANAGAAIGNALGKLVYGDNYKKQDFKDVLLTASRLPTAPLAALYAQLEKLGGPIGKAANFMSDLISKTDQFSQKILGMDAAVDEAGAGLRDFNQEATNAQATKSYIQYRQQEQQAEETYSRQRAQIVEQGARQIAQIEANYAQQRTQLIQQFAASSAQAVSNFQFQQQQAAEQFAFSEANAVKEYNKRQGEQQEEFRKSEERSRENHLREMRRLEEEHGDRVRDLVASRDALGLVREKRDFERRKRDAEESYRTDRARRREDFKKQQRDQEEEFQAQRDRRRQEFEFRQQQAAEQFARQQELARAQFEERLKQLEDEHQEQLSQTRRQTSERLRELQLQFQQEQITRRNAFLDILRDLDANLLNERNVRVQYYAQMQKDLLAFLQSTSGQIGSNLPGYPTETHAAGGYGPGYVGAGEFVASRATTRRLEGMIGGRLTQQSVQSMSRTNTVNLEFPGGLLTAKVASEMMDRKLSDLVGDLTKGISR